MKFKKITSVILAVALIFSVTTVPAVAREDVTNSFAQKGYIFLDKIISGLVSGISAMIATPRWPQKSEFKSENFYPGYAKDEYKLEAGEDDCWNIGYSNASILTGNEVGGDGDYYVGGSLSITKKLATSQLDDQKVRTIAISDGRGISIFSAIDCFGFSSTDVKVIRKMFAEYAESEGLDIVSINISALHQHSCVDTFGMNGDIIDALFFSSFRTLTGQELPGGKNKDYMNNLYKVTFNTMKEAVNNMEAGSLYYGSVDVSDYIRDKRDPQVYDKNMNRFRFVPFDETSKEIWIANAGIHCVGHGAGGTDLTGDYPYYMEKYINENYDADLFYILGAQLAITSKGDALNLDPELDASDETYSMRMLGERFAQLMNSIDNEVEVEPIFNISYTQTFVEIENKIFILAAKGGLLSADVYKDGLFKTVVATEVGYAEFGKDIAVSIIPGELAPEIAFGGAETAETSWYGKDWEYPSFQSLTPEKKLIVFGLTNDQIGYLLTSNNWHSILTENEEIVSCGQHAGETITQAYIDLIKEIKG